MLSGSGSILFLIVLTGMATCGVFLWALLGGHLDDLEAQSRAVFDERDLRLRRPWESDDDVRLRARHHGAPITPAASEWGGGR